MENTQIPHITLSENKVVLATLDVPLIVNDEQVIIKLQKITAGQKREAVKTAANTKIVGQQVQGSVDAVGYQISILSKVIIDAPFDTSEKSISELPGDILDYLYEKYTDWTDVKKKD